MYRWYAGCVCSGCSSSCITTDGNRIKEKMKKELASQDGMGEVLLTHKMKRFRPDGTSDWLLIEISKPEEARLGHIDCWKCKMRISGLPEVVDVTGFSSLHVISRATVLAGGIIRELPYADSLMHSGLPNFGLPLCPITTTPEFLETERKRAKYHKENFSKNYAKIIKK